MAKISPPPGANGTHRCGLVKTQTASSCFQGCTHPLTAHCGFPLTFPCTCLPTYLLALLLTPTDSCTQPSMQHFHTTHTSPTHPPRFLLSTHTSLPMHTPSFLQIPLLQACPPWPSPPQTHACTQRCCNQTSGWSCLFLSSRPTELWISWDPFT